MRFLVVQPYWLDLRWKQAWKDSSGGDGLSCPFEVCESLPQDQIQTTLNCSVLIAGSIVPAKIPHLILFN